MYDQTQVAFLYETLITWRFRHCLQCELWSYTCRTDDRIRQISEFGVSLGFPRRASSCFSYQIKVLPPTLACRPTSWFKNVVTLWPNLAALNFVKVWRIPKKSAIGWSQLFDRSVQQKLYLLRDPGLARSVSENVCILSLATWSPLVQLQ